MPIGFDEIHLETTDTRKIVTLLIKGRLDRKDYEQFVPQLEFLIEKNGAINLMIELEDFQGWTVGAFWEDTKFSLRHFSDIEKLAIVGEGRRLEKGVTAFLAPFTKAEVRYFDKGKKEEARQWLGAE